MPNLQTIRAGIAELPKGPPLVVALVGGTTGIGSYVARALATTFTSHGSKLRVYIVGRRADRAENLLIFGRKTSPGSDWRFVQTSDTSLMSNVDAVAESIINQEEEAPFCGGPARLDVLYLSTALSPLQESKATKEGIDTQMSLLYYSRIRFIQSLTPLLTATPHTAHVISIFAGNMEDSIKSGEIPIGIPPPTSYGITTVRKYVTFMKTFAFEELAEKNAGKISFVHIYPGLVDGPSFYSDVNPLWARIVWRVLKPLVSWYITSEKVCGEVMVYLATQRYPAKGALKPGQESQLISEVAYSTQYELGGGAYAVGQRGDERKQVSWAKARKSDTLNNVWAHTTETLEEVERKNAAL